MLHIIITQLNLSFCSLYSTTNVAEILVEHPHLLGADLSGWSALWHEFRVPVKTRIQLMKRHSEAMVKQDPAHALANMASLRSFGMSDHVGVGLVEYRVKI